MLRTALAAPVSRLQPAVSTSSRCFAVRFDADQQEVDDTLDRHLVRAAAGVAGANLSSSADSLAFGIDKGSGKDNPASTTAPLT
eukprot:scaffold663847_cov59-Prasinocladus_malaysianus.AAC.1